MDNDKIYDIALIAPNCFYYQTDLFRQLASHPRIALTVYFCSTESLESRDLENTYRVKDSWGTGEELLEGYNYKFVRNYSPSPYYLNSMIGLMNLGIWQEINRSRPDAVILMSWMNPNF